jgi:hypothetical protein
VPAHPQPLLHQRARGIGVAVGLKLPRGSIHPQAGLCGSSNSSNTTTQGGGWRFNTDRAVSGHFAGSHSHVG